MAHLRPLAQTQTVELYFLSQQARFKLVRESNDDSPDLRKLLAHANLVDLLADELQSRRPKPRTRPVVFPEHGYSSGSYDSSDESSSEDEEEPSDYDDNVGIVGDDLSLTVTGLRPVKT
ncbi:hypothetical protein CJU89_3661 [Yarrowia sp. B02]|nr:hypothetical protein CJU89_3661 [Yarrowia sp. B02]